MPSIQLAGEGTTIKQSTPLTDAAEKTGVEPTMVIDGKQEVRSLFDMAAERQDPNHAQWTYVMPNADGSYDTKIDFSNYNLREDFVAASCPPMFEPVEQCPWCKKQLRRVLDWPYYNWLVCENKKCLCKGVQTEHKLEYVPVVHWCEGCMDNFRSDAFPRKFCSNSSYVNQLWHPHQVLDPNKVVKDIRCRAEVVRKDIPANPDSSFPEDHDDESNEAPKDNALPPGWEFAFNELGILHRKLGGGFEAGLIKIKPSEFISDDVWERYATTKPKDESETNKVATMIFHANSKPI